MKKITIYLSCLSLIFIFSFTIFSINDIKKVYGTKLETTNYTNFINVTGEFTSTDSEEIIFSHPIYVKEVFIDINSDIKLNQPLFSIDKEKMLEMAQDYNYMQSDTDLNDEINLLSDIIYSNSDGYISSINIKNGDIIMANTQVLKISAYDDLIAKFTVSQSDFGKISVGDIAYINSLAFSDIDYIGKISDKTAIVYEEVSVLGSKVLVDIFADISNLDNKAAEGLQLTAKIESDNLNNINILSYDYINQDENGEFVFILKDGVAYKEYIITGVETESGQEILNDFSSDTIFIKGDIKEFDKVVLIK